MAQVKLSISVDDDHLSGEKFWDVVERLKKAGMSVREPLEALGIIVGSADARDLGDIKRVAGGSELEEERSIRIPPPNHDVQ